MSRTVNTMPLDLKRLEAAHLRAPRDVHAYTWGQRPKVRYRNGRLAGGLDSFESEKRCRELLADAEELDATFWSRGYGGPGLTGPATPGC